MKNTRLMEVLFSATDEKDEELVNQVASGVEKAKEDGKVDTDELKYEHVGDGKVAITDKENGEVTIAEKAEDGNYDLYPAEPTEQPEGFIHPEGDGVTPGPQKGAEDEHVEDHLSPEAIEECPAKNIEEVPAEEAGEEGREPRAEDAEDQVCPECGKNPCECEGEEKEFSVSTDNQVVLRIFSDQEFCERLFSEVIESEETAKVGDLKVEKVDDNAVVVTSEATGDQAKVTLDDEEMEVTELDSKNFSDDEEAPAEEEESDDQYLPLHIVGVDSFNHVIVDAPAYSEEDAEELMARLSEQGIDALQIFGSFDEARDYAFQLLQGLGASDVEEPEEATFSDTDEFELYVTKYYSDNTVYMDRLFSEAANDVETSQEVIEDAIENGEEIENDSEIVTPVDAHTAVVEDKENDEFTKVVIDDDKMNFIPIGSSEAEELTSHLAVDSAGAGNKSDEDRVAEGREESKEFSDVVEKYFSNTDEEVYCDSEETKFFSESEEMTDYMVRLFSEESDSEKIEDAIENGEEIENDSEIITPIDNKSAIIEDKENGEYTKAELSEGEIELHPISSEDAKEELSDVVVEDKEEDADDKKEDAEEKEDDEKEEKKFSEPLSKFFAEAGVAAPAAAEAPVAEAPVREFIVDENGNPIRPADAPVEAEGEAPVEGAAPAAPAMSPEAIEDKALAAVQSIQAAAAEMEAQVLNAKAAPVEGAEQDLQEAHFSETEKTFSDNDDNTLVSWLGNIR